ncbi:hypothetical protein BV372_20200 [Nostoc sp. T09]|uniref:iron uptake porin n=1 Tax=Nostoc sp. T09 TaxID=1932621 RepID=UPI000A376E14|nr:iron uptake porin [Nostoc sp. T09]OUL31562.1 hypothetical protein BV372_20200 [Nostoc sp. T09]
MKKNFDNLLLTLPTFVVLLLLATNAKTFAQVVSAQQETETSSYTLSPWDKTLVGADLTANFPVSAKGANIYAQNTPETTPAQPTIDSPVTSVSELSDVQPTDWAFQALQSLVERYGCIVGYPDSRYRGNRALTRYEFAAGLSSCLDQVSKLIATSTSDLAIKQDLETLQRLTEEFSQELAQLRGRLDGLEARTAQVEANQFSTTTKLVGDTIFVVSDAVGDRANNTAADDTGDDSNTIFSYRTRLSLQTSFTGKDQLVTALQAENVSNLAASTGTHMTRFALDGSANFAQNSLYLANLYYRFPIGKKATAWIGPRTMNFPLWVPTLNALNGNPLQGGFSRFGQFNPTVYRPGFDGAGAAFAYKFNDQLQIHLGYIADSFFANQPQNGVFNNSSQASLAQITFSPSKQFDLGLTYVRKYFPTNSGNNLTGGTGSAFARNPFGQLATTSDNFGLEFNWRVSQRFNFGGWFGYTLAHQEVGAENDATIINAALTFGFPDLFKKGNVGGITVGIPPKVTSNDFVQAGQRREDPDTSLHFETFYRFRVNDNISVTPIFYFITKPEHNAANDSIWVGVLRTSFTF